MKISHYKAVMQQGALQWQPVEADQRLCRSTTLSTVYGVLLRWNMLLFGTVISPVEKMIYVSICICAIWGPPAGSSNFSVRICLSVFVYASHASTRMCECVMCVSVWCGVFSVCQSAHVHASHAFASVSVCLPSVTCLAVTQLLCVSVCVCEQERP